MLALQYMKLYNVAMEKYKAYDIKFKLKAVDVVKRDNPVLILHKNLA